MAGPPNVQEGLLGTDSERVRPECTSDPQSFRFHSSTCVFFTWTGHHSTNMHQYSIRREHDFPMYVRLELSRSTTKLPRCVEKSWSRSRDDTSRTMPDTSALHLSILLDNICLCIEGPSPDLPWKIPLQKITTSYRSVSKSPTGCLAWTKIPYAFFKMAYRIECPFIVLPFFLLQDGVARMNRSTKKNGAVRNSPLWKGNPKKIKNRTRIPMLLVEIILQHDCSVLHFRNGAWWCWFIKADNTITPICNIPRHFINAHWRRLDKQRRVKTVMWLFQNAPPIIPSSFRLFLLYTN